MCKSICQFLLLGCLSASLFLCADEGESDQDTVSQTPSTQNVQTTSESSIKYCSCKCGCVDPCSCGCDADHPCKCPQQQ